MVFREEAKALSSVVAASFQLSMDFREESKALSSVVAASFQLSMVFREESKALSSAQNSPSLSTLSLNLPETSSFSLTALISFSMIFFLSSGRVIHMHWKLLLMEEKRPVMLPLELLYRSCLFLRSSRADWRLNLFLTFLISSSAFSNSDAMVSLFSAYPTQASLVSCRSFSLS